MPTEPSTKQEQIDKLVAQMELHEKTAQMNVVGRHPALDFSIDQDNVDRLGIPAIRAIDGPRGIHLLGTHKSTCFPAALALAASWNPRLVTEVLGAITDQLIGHGLHQLYAPGLNIIIDPRCGRNAEYFGEDPQLTARMAIAACRGIEEKGAIATPKHYCCNSFEAGRFVVDARVPQRPLREIFLRAFEILVREARPRSIMTSYNSVNGHFLSANRELQDILRSWGFDGFVVSDWGANMENTPNALLAGTDMEMPGHRYFTPEKLTSALEAGEISTTDIDRAVRNVLRVKQQIGLLDNAYPQASEAPSNQSALLRRAGAEAIVLLKNEGPILPLELNKKSKLALFGPFADNEDILGNQGSSTVPPTDCVTIRQGLEQAAAHAVDYLPGCEHFAYSGATMHNNLEFEAEYFDNRDWRGHPVLKRKESGLKHRPFLTGEIPGQVPGIQGNAWNFSGMLQSSLGELPGVQANGDFSLSLWYYLPEQLPTNDAPILAIENDQPSVLHLNPGEVRLVVAPDYRQKISYPFISQRWAHAAIVRDGQALKLYIDGQHVGDCPFERVLPNPVLTLGGSPQSGKCVACRIDELHVYDRALDASEIATLFQQKDVPGHTLHENCEKPIEISTELKIAEIKDATNFSARYRTTFKPRLNGKHAFRVTGHDGVRVRLDGTPLVDSNFEQHLNGIHHYAWPLLEAGREYQLEIDYSASRPNGYLSMEYCHPPNEDLFREVREKAAAAESAIVSVGVHANEYQGEAVDSSSFSLPGWQDELIEAVAQANPRTIVLLSTAGGVDMRRWIESVPAVLAIWPQGEEAGNAVADILYGAANPSGRLPLSFPLSVDQLDTPFAKADYADSICDVGYRRFDKRQEEVLFPFGHGLSYTNFEWSDLQLSETDDGWATEITVTNSGTRKGRETVQIYASFKDSSVERSPCSLVAFEQITLDPGAAGRLNIPIPRHALAYWNCKAGDWQVEPGEVEFIAARSSRHPLLKETLLIGQQ